MVVTDHRQTPPPPRNPARVSPQSTKSMALNPEPASSTQRWENSLPPKSYADAVQEGTDQVNSDSDTAIDESSVKETPPRTRKDSEPRAFGEVIDEADTTFRSHSPTLRHVKGRLEEEDSRESYADAVKSSPPPLHVNGYTNGVEHVDGDRTPEVLDGWGGDDEPDSPTWRARHQQTPSTSINGEAEKEKSRVLPSEDIIKEPVQDPADAPGYLLYENVTNKSGENLASLRPGDGYYLSLQQRSNKDATSEPPAESTAATAQTANSSPAAEQAQAGPAAQSAGLPGTFPSNAASKPS